MLTEIFDKNDKKIISQISSGKRVAEIIKIFLTDVRRKSVQIRETLDTDRYQSAVLRFLICLDL